MMFSHSDAEYLSSLILSGVVLPFSGGGEGDYLWFGHEL